jgi:3-oxoacyl-[acyl-carrier-protein] synthase-1
MQKILKVKKLAIHSCLAKGATFTAAAMHCGYDGFEETSFAQPYSIENQLGATIRNDFNTRGLSKLIELCGNVVTEITQTNHIDFSKVPLYICLQEIERPSSFSIEELQAELFHNIVKTLNIPKLHPHSRAYLKGKAGFATALKQAQVDIYDNKHEQILIVSVDSLINSASLSYYAGDMYGEGCRLLTDSNSNGFIPGEAATAILLSKPIGEENEIIISGVGTAKEPATIYNKEELLKGAGLSKAIMEASNQAKVPIHETFFRVGSMSGEEYFFDEATLAQIKTLKQKIPDHPLWHPADSIGEVGAAIGGAMVIQTYYTMLKGYAPGENALCHISNDDELRGAFIMQHTHKTIHKEKPTEPLEGMYFSDIIKAQLKHDAPYAWFLKETSHHSPLFRKKDIQRLEERLESYMECFILSQRANDSLLEMLNLDDWGAVYVMARVALVCEDEDVFSKAVQAVNSKQQAKELSDALKCKTYKALKIKLQTLLTHANPWVRMAGVDTLKYLKVHIEPSSMQRLLEDEASQVQEAVLKLIGEHKLGAYTQEIKVFVDYENEDVQYAATYVGCMLQVPKAYQTLQTFCFSQSPYLREALVLLYGAVKEDKIPSLLQNIGKQILSPHIKAYNLAMAGYPEAVPLLINEMQKIDHALYCAEAFSFITGVDLEEADLIRVENISEEEEEILTASRQTDKWTQSYEEDMPLPDVERVKAWWQNHQHHFIHGTRYIAGKTYSQENLENIKETGNQAQQTVADLILKLKYIKKVALRDDLFHLEKQQTNKQITPI